MEEEHLLCIGGPVDGGWYACEGDILWIPIRDRYPIIDRSLKDSPESIAIEMKAARYRRVGIGTEGGYIEVWIHSEMSTHNALLRVLDYYGR